MCVHRIRVYIFMDSQYVVSWAFLLYRQSELCALSMNNTLKLVCRSGLGASGQTQTTVVHTVLQLIPGGSWQSNKRSNMMRKCKVIVVLVQKGFRAWLTISGYKKDPVMKAPRKPRDGQERQQNLNVLYQKSLAWNRFAQKSLLLITLCPACVGTDK